MKTRNRISKWGPAAGVLAIGVLAFSISLEGAPTPRNAGRQTNSAAKQDQSGSVPARSASREKASSKSAVMPADESVVQPLSHEATPITATVSDEDRQAFAAIKFGRMPQGELPIAPPMTVDYRDDEGSRLRQAGLLIGPYRPRAQAVAAGNCSFDIDCDDCNPCTQDTCTIAVGSLPNTGICSNQALGDRTEGECSDGLCCNGRETCFNSNAAAVCGGGGTCTVGAHAGKSCSVGAAGDAFCKTGACDQPGNPHGTFDSNTCQFPCAAKSCVLGVKNGLGCLLDTDCDSRACVGGVNPSALCTSNVDCRVCVGGSTPGAVCSGDPSCSGKACVGGLNPGALCTSAAACRVCLGGSNAGAVCTSAAACRVCVGGTNPGTLCTTGATECNGGGTCPEGGTCPAGGTCVAGTCPAGGTCGAPGTCTGPQLVCNESNNLCRPACNGTNFCAVDGLPCTDSSKCNSAIPNNYCKNCQDGLVCNGTEICTAGVCEPPIVTNPCGGSIQLPPSPNVVGAFCGEKKCSTPVGGPPSCTTDSDCLPSFGTCSSAGPVCLPGRCCKNGTAEPICEKRSKASCDTEGGVWYASDAGYLPVAEGLICPTPPPPTNPLAPLDNRTLCPNYSSGIAPPIVDTLPQTALIPGPFSDSLCDHHAIGDDYRFENGKFMALEKFRWVGAGGDRLTVELYDDSTPPKFIEDIVTGGIGGSIAVRTLRFVPELPIPPRGWVVIRVASQFAPNGRTFWVSTDAVDEGINDSTKLWIDNGPVSSYLQECVGGTQDGTWCDPADFSGDCVAGGGLCTPRPNILAFELEGLTTTTEPRGACCNATAAACENELPWICEGAGNFFLGATAKCALCDSGLDSGKYCRRCSNNPATPCNKNSDCGGTNTCIKTNSACNQTIGTCSNNETTTCTVPTQTTDCGAGNTCILPTCVEDGDVVCGVGACCVAATGNCYAVTESNCTTNGTCDTSGVCTELSCVGGPFAGFTCSTTADCAGCVGGAKHGLACAVVADCQVTGTYQGSGTSCVPNCCLQPTVINRCTGEPDAGSTCAVANNCPGVCVGGSNPGTSCTSITQCLGGGTCSATCSLFCEGGVNPNTACTSAADCRVCVGGSNPGGECTLAVDCQVCVSGANQGGKCTNSSQCPGGSCGTAGTCPAGGTCTGSQKCFGGTRNGLACDCEQGTCSAGPRLTGGDNCQDVLVNVITVPPYLNPKTVTISGNNAGATGPDSCLKGAWNASGGTVLSVDPGWWEAFKIDKCAFVRVDYCCSDPTVEPQWNFLWKGCPCDQAEFFAVDPNKLNELSNKRGGPYCPYDDNLWLKFGPLAAGTYYEPVYSLLQGRGGEPGPYQMHITVDGCPSAACCNGQSCADRDQLACAAIDAANYLAPPFRENSTLCGDPSTICNTGSCCYAPSAPKICQDIDANGFLFDKASCDGSNGIYRGGARCKGGVCTQGNPAKSCATTDDCTDGGTCSGGPTDLSQPSPCPVCDFESNSRCQKVPTYAGARLSDLCVGNCVEDPPDSEFSLPTIRVADDFVADVGGDLTSVCVWGIYGDQGPGGLPDCSAGCVREEFTVKIYNDIGGLPGTLVTPARTTTITRKGETFVTSGGRHVFQWQLKLSAPIPLTQGNTYWLEVVNDTDNRPAGNPPCSPNENCDWFWALSDSSLLPDSGNGLLLQDSGDSYTFGDAIFDSDQAWCLTIANSVPPILERACCTCAGGVGTCGVKSLLQCGLEDGQWYPADVECTGVVCRNTADEADNCSTQKIAVASDSATPWNNLCTNTDGPPSAADCLTSETAVSNALQNDLWYTWTADCNGDAIIETCDVGGELNTIMAIYSNPAPICVGGPNPGAVCANNRECRKCVGGSNAGGLCEVDADCKVCVLGGNPGTPCTSNLQCTLGGTCGAAGTCPAVGVCTSTTCMCPTSAASQLDCSDDGCVFNGAGSRITLNVTNGVCYTIRIGGVLGEKGQGVLHVTSCSSAPPPPPPIADPSGIDKSRFISFSVSGAATAAVGETALRVKLTSLHHVSPPYTDAASIPFTLFEGKSMWVGPPATYIESESSLTPFNASQLQCDPHYRDWSTVGLLAVTGEGIVPSSSYSVENLAFACQGQETTPPCLSGGASVSAPLTIKTGRWGDAVADFQLDCANQVPVCTPCNAACVQQPDFTDIGELVSKFKSLVGAPIKARAKLAGVDARGLMDITPDVGFDDIPLCVDAFKGRAYPYKPGKCTSAPATACKDNTECGGTGPCILCP